MRMRGGLALPAVLDGVVDQVGQDLHQTPLPGAHRRANGNVERHLHVLLGDRQVPVPQNGLDEGAHVDVGRATGSPRPGASSGAGLRSADPGSSRPPRSAQAEAGALAQPVAVLAGEFVRIPGDAA